MPLTPYRLMYWAGFTPWDREYVPRQLADFVSGPDAIPRGRALDLGCGTGTHAVFLARLGWRVTGVDFVEAALRKARRRADNAGVEVEWVHADVTRLDETSIRPGYDLVYDIGCFHGLPDDGRSSCAASLGALASPGARLLLMGFVPGRRGPAPRGIDAEEVRSLFEPGWTLVDISRGDDAELPFFLRNARPTWYELVRQSHVELRASRASDAAAHR